MSTTITSHQFIASVTPAAFRAARCRKIIEADGPDSYGAYCDTHGGGWPCAHAEAAQYRLDGLPTPWYLPGSTQPRPSEAELIASYKSLADTPAPF